MLIPLNFQHTPSLPAVFLNDSELNIETDECFIIVQPLELKEKSLRIKKEIIFMIKNVLFRTIKQSFSKKSKTVLFRTKITFVLGLGEKKSN